MTNDGSTKEEEKQKDKTNKTIISHARNISKKMSGVLWILIYIYINID